MPRPTSDLTGGTRYRSQRFTRALILQVEERYQDYRIRFGPNPRTSVRWRDARPYDLYVLAWLEREERSKPAEMPE